MLFEDFSNLLLFEFYLSKPEELFFFDFNYHIGLNLIPGKEPHLIYENRTKDSMILIKPFSNIENGLGIFTAFRFAEATIEFIKQKYRLKAIGAN